MDVKAHGALLEILGQRAKYSAFHLWKPYPKQALHMMLGQTKRERLLMAGNQLGKTETGAYETTAHLTGLYPEGWQGRKFDKPVRCWAAGETSLVVRDVQQKKLCGSPGVLADHGSGFIPKAAFIDKPSLSRGVTDAYDQIQVRHISGGTSVLMFKSYEQGRQKFQGETLDFVWLDEEPPIDIYSECLTRVTATAGMIFVTFTPLKGMSSVVARYLQGGSDDRVVTTMTIDDVEHISAAEKHKIIAGYLPHERDARLRGIPMLGSGRIFQFPDEQVMENPIVNIPGYWTKLWGIDFGINHPFAAVLGLWDRDNDIIHIHHAIRMADRMPVDHCRAMKTIGAAVPVAWPHDGHARDKGSGKALSSQYKSEGMWMLDEHATHPEGGYQVEPVVAEICDRIAVGKFKVANHLSDWFEEFRMYHRKNGLIVAERDDLMSATQKMVMMKRKAQAVPVGNLARRRRPQAVADGVDFDVFNP